MKKILILSGVFLIFTVVANAQGNGKISGKLTYPSDYIPPDMVICLESATQTVCSNSKNKGGFVFSVNPATARYSVSLSPGSYYIYAKTKEMVGEKAYYNQFVKCGMSVDCKSKAKILLVVKAGKTISGITVGDWYP